MYGVCSLHQSLYSWIIMLIPFPFFFFTKRRKKSILYVFQCTPIECIFICSSHTYFMLCGTIFSSSINTYQQEHFLLTHITLYFSIFSSSLHCSFLYLLLVCLPIYVNVFTTQEKHLPVHQQNHVYPQASARYIQT